MFLEEKPSGFCELTERLKHYCIAVFVENFRVKNLTLSNNRKMKLSKRQAYYTVGLFPSDNETLHLFKVETRPGYYFLVETHGNDLRGTYRIEVWLDELEAALPKKMLEELNNEFYKFIDIMDD